MAPQPASSHTLADYLVRGYWHDSGHSAYRFATSRDNVLSVNLSGLTGAGQELARKALAAWETVADIDFRETTGSADITIDDRNSGALTTAKYSSGVAVSANVNIGTDWLSKYGTSVGSYAFHTFLHEIGHALGLGHPGTYSGGATYASARFTTDSWQQSVMSYLDQDENPNVAAAKSYALTPMMADILAIQKLYGAAKGGPTSGNTTYGVGSDLGTYVDLAFRGTGGSLTQNALTIFDESGADTFNFGNDSQDQEASLTGGSLLSVYGRTDNVAIAHGTLIENYVAGSGDDRIVGNQAANALLLGDGDDLGVGLLGHDRIRGGLGADRIDGGGGDDDLLGDAGNDRLKGGYGNDRLEGGSGQNDLAGGAGRDTFVIRNGQDVVEGFEDDVDTILLDDALWAGESLGVAGVLRMARLSRDGDIRFTFEGGHGLLIKGIDDIASLADDLAIV